MALGKGRTFAPLVSDGENRSRTNEGRAGCLVSLSGIFLIVVEEKSLEVKPALDFITQPANESVQKKVQESLERLNSHKPQETAEFIESTITLNEPETVNEPAFVRTYEFNGRLGTISSVAHTKAEMTLAKASDEMPQPFPIIEWQDSRYYFYGKGAAGHHCAISHVYSEPTRAKSE